MGMNVLLCIGSVVGSAAITISSVDFVLSPEHGCCIDLWVRVG